MTWEIINTLSWVWQWAVKSIAASIDTLSALWWVIIWWLISFLSAWFVFKKQKEHDIRIKKIDKSLEVLKISSKVKSILWKMDIGSWSINPFHLLVEKKWLDQFMDLCQDIVYWCFFVLNQDLDLDKELDVVRSYYDRDLAERNSNSDKELYEISSELFKKVLLVEENIKKFLKNNQ